MSEKNFSRRNLLRGGLLIGAGAALTGCSFSTTNGVTTISVKNAVVENYTDVGLSVLTAALGFTGVPAAVVTVVDDGIAVIKAGLAAYVKNAGSTTTLTFDKNSVPAALTSLINDFSVVASNISAIATAEKSNLSSSLMTKISQVATDVASAGSVIESLISAVTAGPITGVSAEVRRQLIIDNIKARYGIN